MNPLIELKDRLHQSAIAGTDLLNEDFRLKKIAEQITPLSVKNSIFKKILERLNELFNADNEHKPEKLINTISLVDAVVATQATYKIDGDISELPKSNGVYNNISYSIVFPLINALTTTGSGRYEIVSEFYNDIIKAGSNSFKESISFKIVTDFRIKKYLIKALDDSYIGISNLVVEILKLIGDEQFVEILKKDFDISKKNAIAKLKIISYIAKEKENDFYRYIYENGSKAIKAEALECLKYSKDNAEYLISSIKKLNPNVLRVIEQISDENQDDFWVKFYKETKDFTNICLVAPKTEKVSDAVADRVIKEFIEYLKVGFVFNSDKIEDYVNFIAYSFQSIGNTLYSSFSDNQYKFDYDSNFRNFIYKSISNDEKYDMQFWKMRAVLGGCTLDSLIRIANVITPIVYDDYIKCVENEKKDVYKKGYYSFFWELNYAIITRFLDAPSGLDAHKIIVLYQTHDFIYSMCGLIATLFVKPTVTYDEFICLTYISDNDIVNKLRNDLSYNSKSLNYYEVIHDMINKGIKNIFTYLNFNNDDKELYFLEKRTGVKKLDISWFKNLDKILIEPQKAYSLIEHSITEEEKLAINEYTIYILHYMKEVYEKIIKNGNNYVYSDEIAMLVKSIYLVKQLGITSPKELAYIYINLIMSLKSRFYLYGEVLTMLLCGIESKEEKIECINYAIKYVNEHYTNQSSSMLTKFLMFKKLIEADDEMFSDEKIAISQLSYYLTS